MGLEPTTFSLGSFIVVLLHKGFKPTSFFFTPNLPHILENLAWLELFKLRQRG